MLLLAQLNIYFFKKSVHAPLRSVKLRYRFWQNDKSKGLFTWRKEDPSTRKILEGGSTLHWVYMQKFWSVWYPNIEGIKNGGRQKQTHNLGPSAFFTGVNNFLSAELSQ